MRRKPLTDTQFVKVRYAFWPSRGRIVRFILVDTSDGTQSETTIAADLLARNLLDRRWQSEYLAAIWNNLAWNHWRKFVDSKYEGSEI